MTNNDIPVVISFFIETLNEWPNFWIKMEIDHIFEYDPKLTQRKIVPEPNFNANPKSNPNSDRGAIFLGGNFPDTKIIWNIEILECLRTKLFSAQ